MEKYKRGEADPSRARLVAIARAANVNLQWLATGEGPMRPGEIEYQGEGVEDAQLFDKVVRVLEDALDEADLYIPAKDKGNVIREVYQEALAEEKAGRDATQKIKAVAKIIKLAEHRKRGKA